MKLIPYMIYVDYNHTGSRIENKFLPINQIFIESKINYEREKNFWYTQNHYRAFIPLNDRKEARIFQIGFKLEDYNNDINDIVVQFKQNKNEKSIILCYHDVYKVWFQKSVFQNKRNKETGLYNPENKDNFLRGLNHAGEVEVEVYVKEEYVLSERVLFLPSSISVSDYNIMIADLYRIREELVIKNKVEVKIGVHKEKTIDSLEKIISKIEGPIRYINKFPASNIKIEKNFIKDKTISRFNPEVEIQRKINHGKLKYKTLIKKEDVSIRENTIVKQQLQQLGDYCLKLLAPQELVDSDKEALWIEAVSILEKSSNRIRNKILREGIHQLNKTDIKELLNEIKKEVEDTLNKILSRKQYIYQKLFQNKFVNQDDRTGIPVILFLKVFAKYYYKSMDYSKGKVSVTIGSGKIPDDKRPSILFEGYKYYSNNQWVDPLEVNSIFCEILNGSTSNKEQLIILKALNECLGTEEKIHEGIDFEIKGFLSRNVQYRNDTDIIGKPKQNSIRKDYKFIFNKIHSVSINNNNYLLNANEDETVDELANYLLDHDEEVQELQEKMLRLETEEQTVLKLNALINEQTLISKEANRYKEVANRVRTLLELSMFQGIRDTSLQPLIPTQLFLHDPYYKKIWRCLNDSEKVIGAALIPGNKNKGIGVNNVNEIYEVWSLIKMITILTEKMGWTLTNKQSLIESLDSHLIKRKTVKGFKVNLELGGILLEITYEPKILFEGDINSKRPDFRFLFKRKNYFGNIEDFGVVYLDAKYRNYKEQDLYNQGELEWKKDINEVAIGKYGIKPDKDNPNIRTFASFILHPDIVLGMEKEIKGDNYFAYYNKKLFPGLLEKQNQEEVHKYGSIYLLPTATHSFVTWFKMILEYKLNLHEKCWSCGNQYSIRRETKYTGKGYPKYYYYCENDKCNEFWIKNHCSQKGHKLVKHVNNYHRQKSRNYEWYVVCPTCGDGYQENQ